VKTIAIVALAALAALGPWSAAPSAPQYLYLWTASADSTQPDFLAVLDVSEDSSAVRLVTTLPVPGRRNGPHHTDYDLAADRQLFASGFPSGRTFIFDLTTPAAPRLAGQFGDMEVYSHPHSFVRLPNGNVLATFQHAHAAQKSGGLVEIDDRGKVIRSASSADPALPSALLMPYGLVVVPELDRVVSTNSSMHLDDIFSGSTYQVWRLSDLKLLKTTYLDVGANHYGQISPQEPRLGPDGSVFVQTLGCGIERITQVQTPAPQSQLVHTFPGNWCGVPTIVGHYLVQSVPAIHGLIVLDIANAAKPTEVSRLTLSDVYRPHWTAWDAKAQRLIVTSSNSPADRLYLLKLDPATGALSIDDAFRDQDGRTGFSFAERAWPHGWKGAGIPHGAVASR